MKVALCNVDNLPMPSIEQLDEACSYFDSLPIEKVRSLYPKPLPVGKGNVVVVLVDPTDTWMADMQAFADMLAVYISLARDLNSSNVEVRSSLANESATAADTKPKGNKRGRRSRPKTRK